MLVTYNGSAYEFLSQLAIEALDGHAYGTEAERTAERAENNSRAIGELVETLYAAGVIRMETVEEILNAYGIEEQT